MGKYHLAWEFGVPSVTQGRALANFNTLLGERPYVLGVALLANMNGNAPGMLREALGGQTTVVDPAEAQAVYQAASAVLDKTRDGRVLGFEGGDSAYGDIWGHTMNTRNEVWNGDRPMQDLGLAVLATSVALTLAERQAA